MIILELLKQKQRATLEELQELTESSASTIRRDLNELEEEQQLRRIHGGAERIQDFSDELSYFEKSTKNVQEKQNIAKKALKKIANGDTIYLDAGTSTGTLIAELNGLKMKVTVVTNSVTHASLLINEQIRVYILGGLIKKSTDSVIGEQALNQLKNYCFNVAFIGANGYDPENGAMTPDTEEAAVKRTAILQADSSYLLIDKSKIGQRSFVCFASADEIEIITDEIGEDE